MRRHYSYVGPESIRLACANQPLGRHIATVGQLRTWLQQLDAEDPAAEGWATYVVVPEGRLLLAHRRTEHVACAGGDDVLGAGEAQLDPDGEALWLSNYSSGYCPDASCYDAVSAAFTSAGIGVPPSFSHAVVFRKCPGCGERNVVKDGDFTCSLCESALPEHWNF